MGVAGVLLHRLGVTLFVCISILLVRGGSVYAKFRHLGQRSRLTLGENQRHRSADHRRRDDGRGIEVR